MDWQIITNAVETARMPNGTIDEDFLNTLDTNSPEISNEVRRIIQQNQHANAFMMTAVGDFLPPSKALYSTGDVLGSWKIDSLLGSGGMGDVYKAERADDLYEQTVAIKVMKGKNQSRKERFNRERQRLASLNHPNIAKIIDGGLSNKGHPYMVMEYIEGRTLLDYVNSHAINRTARLNLFRTICHAVSHAHSQLIIHRDIKSDNVLVDINGQVRLVDFGISTLVGGEDEAGIGSFSLTAASPEQLNGEPLSIHTDIFSLGLLLYQLLTGKLPSRQADGSVQLMTDGMPKDLQAILEACLKYDPANRYTSVAVLDKDIEAYQAHLPVSARQGSQFYKFGKLLKRAPIASTLAAGFVTALVIGLGVSQHFARKANIEAQKAATELKNAQWNLEKADMQSSISIVYVDAFQYAFGRDKNSQLLTQRLKEYLTISQKSDDPLSRAQKSYAIGNHFLSRNDYLSARAAFEPWVTEGYGGDDMLLALGQANLGHVYKNLGEKKLAGTMFQKAEFFYRGTPYENSADHMVAAVSAALLSDDKELMKRARTIVTTMLKTEENPFMKMYMYAQISKIESKAGNWDRAHAAQTSAVEIIDSGALATTYGLDSARLTKAEMDIFLKQNFELAKKQIQSVQAYGKTDKGESQSLGSAYELESIIHWMQGDYEAALPLIEQSRIQLKKYSGMSNAYAQNLAFKVILQTDAGKFTQAVQTIDVLAEIPNNKTDGWLALVSLYVEARRNGINAAQYLYDAKPLDTSKMKLNLRQKFILELLEKEGLKV